MKALCVIGLLAVTGGNCKDIKKDKEPDSGVPDAGQQAEVIDASKETAYKCGDLSKAFGLAYQLIEANIAHGGEVPSNPYEVDPEDWIECLTRFRSCQMNVGEYKDYAPNGPLGWWTDNATQKELKACAPRLPEYNGDWQLGLFDAFIAAEKSKGRCYHSEAGPDGSCEGEQRFLGDGLPIYVQIVNQTPWP